MNLSSYWPGMQDIPRIFKDMDFQNKGYLTLNELKDGLRMLGFRDVDSLDAAAISSLIEIPGVEAKSHDEAAINCSVISEDDFTQIFVRYNTESLQKALSGELLQGETSDLSHGPMHVKRESSYFLNMARIHDENAATSQPVSGRLSSHSQPDRDPVSKAREVYASDVVVTVTDFGQPKEKENRPQGFFHSRRVPLTGLVEVLSQQPNAHNCDEHDKFVRWVDVEGCNLSVTKVLSAVYSLPTGLLSGHSHASARRTQCSSFPCCEGSIRRPTTGIRLVLAFPGVSNYPIHDPANSNGISSKAITDLPPALATSLLEVLLIGSHLVLTIRPSIFATSALKQTLGGPKSLHSAFLDISEALRNAFDKDASSSVFHRLEAYSLGMELVRAGIDVSWDVVKGLQDWRSALASSIRSRLHRSQQQHANFLYEISLELSLRLRTTHDGMRKVSGSDENNPITEAVSSVSRCKEDVDLLVKQARNLGKDFKARQDERMNNTLYVLTLVTTCMIPYQLMSSVYGMNFENMPGLKSDLGFGLWWAVCTAMSMTILFIFWKWRLR
eukprot:CAMPEP_0175126758 /NCGR_PEP_ID=MMETSP0087-20121206/4030_1 /TAXON_ID=136419 /ORGANISM="Unknown Unknown, Strain D1" /LENGTH=555 /DNA_ID=CAMNT_0016408703 /DNA_START=99 /DNA_END=1766 /DNA_ORIENTATION=-